MSNSDRSSRHFDRDGVGDVFTFIGTGEPGGKASGLAFLKGALDERFPDHSFEGIRVDIPRSTVLLTGVFDQFIAQNGLAGLLDEDLSDAEVARRFQRASLPPSAVGDLFSLASRSRLPLAVRSSSLLEDSEEAPFAGAYETKMIANVFKDTEMRFSRLAEAVKFVYASLFQRPAKSYFSSIGQDIHREKMAVVIQEVVGYPFEDLFYPAISGVGRSYNFYPSGHAKPNDGIVNLVLGLGKTIMDGGRSWTYCPAYPAAPPPYNSLRDVLQQSQSKFWAVRLSPPAVYDPIGEAEYLVHRGYREAEGHGVLDDLCSTYDIESERLNSGVSGEGPRVLDFSPILCMDTLPLNSLIRELLQVAESRYGEKVEVEFAVALDRRGRKPPKFGFLQVRPMRVTAGYVDLKVADERPDWVRIWSSQALGNGEREDIRDIVYVRRDKMQASQASRVAREVEGMNDSMVKRGIPYMLLGPGRWGSSDPWLGIPVRWTQISGARVIVECVLPGMNPDMSQGSHFFHNIISLGVSYFSVPEGSGAFLDWAWVESLHVDEETDFVRHARLDCPLRVMVDGRSGKGVVLSCNQTDQS